MKALSILQPWASLIVHGHKKIETRSFQRSYRGPLLIHASKGMKEAKRLCSSNIDCTNPFCIAGHWAELPYGAIIGMVQLESCVQFSRVLTSYCMGEAHWPLTEQEKAFGDYSAGRYGWLLSDPIVFPEPIPCKGNLGLWVPPADVLKQVEEQFKITSHGK